MNCKSIVVTELFKYALIHTCFTIFVQSVTLLSVIMSYRSEVLNLVVNCCEWDIIAQTSSFVSCTSLAISSILIQFALYNSSDWYGGNFSTFPGFFTLKNSNVSFVAGPEISHYLLNLRHVNFFDSFRYFNSFLA